MTPARLRPGGRRGRWLAGAGALVLVLALVAGVAAAASGLASHAPAARARTPKAPAASARRPKAPLASAPGRKAPTGRSRGPKGPVRPPVGKPHIMVLMMENRSFGDVVGNRAAPYQTMLARNYLTATSSYGVGHYSLDNYLAVLTGHFFPWATSDCTPGSGCQTSEPTLVGQLASRGISWRAFLGSMPGNCDRSNADNGTVGHSYGVRHDPFVYVPQLVHEDCSLIEPSTRMLAALDSGSPPDFVWYSPQICHDGGGDEPCASVSAGDRFLSHEIPAIQATSWYRHGGTIVLTYDEGNGSGQGTGEFLGGAGNHVFTAIISAATYHRGAYRPYVNGFGLLAGIEKAYGVSCLAEACRRSNGTLPLSGALSPAPVPKKARHSLSHRR